MVLSNVVLGVTIDSQLYDQFYTSLTNVGRLIVTVFAPVYHSLSVFQFLFVPNVGHKVTIVVGNQHRCYKVVVN